MTHAAAPYAPGDLVCVVDGPFVNFTGVIREIDATREELLVEVAMFGRPVPIRTEPWQVAPR
jgi:transcriptional antiterminator NusG